MSRPYIIFPHQLFKVALHQSKSTVFHLVEDEGFFGVRVSKKKLVLYRAAMQAFRERLLIRGYVVHYYDASSFPNLESLFLYFRHQGVVELQGYDLEKPVLSRRVQRLCRKHGIDLITIPSPSPAKKKVVSSAKKVKASLLPEVWHPEPNRYVEEAVEYVEQYFPNNPGTTANFWYPVTYADALDWLEDFLEQRLSLVKEYGEAIFYTSPLPLLTEVGLLTWPQVADIINRYVTQHSVTLPVKKAVARFIGE